MRRSFIALALCISCHGSYQDEAAKCQTPRTGIDPRTGQPLYPDKQGSISDEKTWLRGFMGDLYFWYSEIPAADPAKYSTMDSYFQALKTPQKTASGKRKDQFSFTFNTADWRALAQSGVEAGYGATWALVARSPPRKAVVAYTEPNSPAVAAGANLARGAEVIAVDGVAVVDGSADALNAGLFPANAGETHSFTVVDLGGSTQRTFSMTSAAVTSTPVQNAGFLPAPNGTVGYLAFNAHIATAEQELIDAVNQLKGATDLVLDLRYNGGGYLGLASELAFMIAGPAKTSGIVFERQNFNDKYGTNDPIGIGSTPFYAQTPGYIALPAGQPLPHLDLPRVFVLTGSGTCSASEAVINGLIGAGVTVNLIGHTTCGKPYGFYPQDNCGTTYFAIEFEGVNAKGFGDYADGFVPGGGGQAGPPGCQVADDFGHALGDPAEARLAAALQFRATGACPTPSSRAETALSASQEDPYIYRSPALENRILWRPQ